MTKGNVDNSLTLQRLNTPEAVSALLQDGVTVNFRPGQTVCTKNRGAVKASMLESGDVLVSCPNCGHWSPHEARTDSLNSGKCPDCHCLSGWRGASFIAIARYPRSWSQALKLRLHRDLAARYTKFLMIPSEEDAVALSTINDGIETVVQLEDLVDAGA